MPDSDFVSALPAPNIAEVHRQDSIPWQPFFLTAVFLLPYAGVLQKLVHDWWTIPDFSHGFLVPIFSGYLIWKKWPALREATPKPSWAGIAILTVAMAMLVVGALGAELFLTRLSLVLAICGMFVTFLGWRHLRIAAFPVAALLLAIPIPAILFNQITFPLQIFASQLASNLLPLMNVPVLRQGNVIQLPAMPLEVAEACSGIRSLMSLSTLAVFYGYFLETSNVRRLALALLSVPIAVAANAMRIVGTGLCVQYWDPEKALGFFHEFSGWVVFMVSLLLMYALHKLISVGAARWTRVAA
ncbi:MAG: exosortase [Acidobacteriales bacterium]|nr:exosortase [Terriglobales bacterium]